MRSASGVITGAKKGTLKSKTAWTEGHVSPPRHAG